MGRERKPAKRIHKGYMLGDLNLDAEQPPKTKPTAPSKPKPESNDKPFRLLDLPGELVLRVLEFAVVHSDEDDPIDIAAIFDRDSSVQILRHGALSGRPYKKRLWALVQPAITWTCRLLRVEGLKMFYSQNYFMTNSTFEGIEFLEKWLKCLPPISLSLITCVVQWVQQLDGSETEEKELESVAWADFLREIHWLLDNEDFQKIPAKTYLQKDTGKIFLGIAPRCVCYRPGVGRVAYRLGFHQGGEEGEKDEGLWIGMEEAAEKEIEEGSRDFWEDGLSHERIAEALSFSEAGDGLK